MRNHLPLTAMEVSCSRPNFRTTTPMKCLEGSSNKCKIKTKVLNTTNQDLILHQRLEMINTNPRWTPFKLTSSKWTRYTLETTSTLGSNQLTPTWWTPKISWTTKTRLCLRTSLRTPWWQTGTCQRTSISLHLTRTDLSRSLCQESRTWSRSQRASTANLLPTVTKRQETLMPRVHL
jgi:hypothetical protein